MSQIDNKIVNVKALLAAQAVANNIEAVSFNGSDVTPVNKRVSLTETDPTVPAWAKESSKPSYTAAEVGAVQDPVIVEADIKDPNNGLAEDTRTDRSASIVIKDKNGYPAGYFTATAWKDGRTQVSMRAHNYNNGTMYTAAHIAVYVDKDGDISYSLGDPAAFWNALYNSVSVATSSAKGLMAPSDKSKLDGMEVATLAEVKTALGI